MLFVFNKLDCQKLVLWKAWMKGWDERLAANCRFEDLKKIRGACHRVGASTGGRLWASADCGGRSYLKQQIGPGAQLQCKSRDSRDFFALRPIDFLWFFDFQTWIFEDTVIPFVPRLFWLQVMDLKVVLKGAALTLPAGNAGSSGRAFPQLLELPQVVLTAYHSGLRTRKGEWSEWVTESYGQKTWKWWAQNNTEVMVLARLHGCQGIINSFSFTSLLSASLEELRVLASMLKRLGQHLFFGVWKQNHGTSHLQFWEICFETSEWFRRIPYYD